MLSRHDMEKELLVSFSELSAAEEAFKKKKSRVFWLSLGDKNTKFFHQKMRSHCLRNKVLSLENSNGVRLCTPSEVKQEILDYYVGQLGTPFSEKRDAQQVLNLVLTQKVDQDVGMDLVKPVTALEVKQAMWSIKGDKAPAQMIFNSVISNRTGMLWVQKWFKQSNNFSKMGNQALECYCHHIGSKV